MNTLHIEMELAHKYGYQPLSDELSKKYRALFEENIPLFFHDKSVKALRTCNGTKICDDYERIVVGDYGAFVEFTSQQANLESFRIAPGQEYRIEDPKYANVKYHWYTIWDGSSIKIYHQRRKVRYADYKRGMYYVSVHEAFPMTYGRDDTWVQEPRLT